MKNQEQRLQQIKIEKEIFNSCRSIIEMSGVDWKNFIFNVEYNVIALLIVNKNIKVEFISKYEDKEKFITQKINNTIDDNLNIFYRKAFGEICFEMMRRENQGLTFDKDGIIKLFIHFGKREEKNRFF